MTTTAIQPSEAWPAPPRTAAESRLADRIRHRAKVDADYQRRQREEYEPLQRAAWDEAHPHGPTWDEMKSDCT